MKRLKRLILALSTILILLSPLGTALNCQASLAHEQELKTIRVGFFAFEGYHQIDQNGIRSGYGYDLLQEMVGYTNWNYEYVGYDSSWSEMQDMLENGEIDILSSAQKTKERLQRFDFSDEPIGTSAAILTVKAGNTTYTENDYHNWNGIRIGMIKGNSRNDNFANFAKQHNFTYTSVMYQTTEDLLKALTKGSDIDAILTSNLRKLRDEWIVAQFDSSPFYIMVKKGNTELLNTINEALSQLFTNQPGLRTQLWDTYYTPDNGEQIAFSAEELEYIRSMQGVTINAVINPDRDPYSYFSNGQAKGIIGDIANEIIKRSRLNIKIIETSTRSEYEQLAESGTIEVRLDAWHDYAQAEKLGFRLTSPYIDASICMLSQKDNKNHDTAALIANSDIVSKFGDTILTKYQNVTYYATVDEVVKAVLSGAADDAYVYSRTAEKAVHDDMTNQLVIKNVYDSYMEFCVAVDATQDKRLFSILNKVVGSISTDDINEFIIQNSDYADSFSFVGYIYDNPFVLFYVVVAIVIFVALTITTLSLKKKQRAEAARAKEETRRAQLLSDALSEAQKATAAKSQFLSRVSHEMRTPLNAIIGFIELSKDADLATRNEYRNDCLVSAKQLLSVINDVLDMSAIESGKMQIAHSTFNFRQTLLSISNIFLLQCEEKGIKFDTIIENQVDEWLIGDQLRVNQILMNLLGNAVKFTDKGNIRLIVSQQAVKDNQAFIRILVSDTGCGMSEEMKKRLFGAFEQESAETAQRYGGSGLGLSIVKNLVEMMDGAISVESQQGVGTTFTVDLSFTRSDVESNTLIPGGTANLHMLVVDDLPDELSYISTILNRLNVRHTCMSSGQDALTELDSAQAAHDPYNICLIDWKMPKMDGCELTKQIRKRYKKDVVVIVISSYEHHQADATIKQAGADMFVTKPLFQSSLFDLLMNITGGQITPEQKTVTFEDLTGKRVLLAEDNALNRKVAGALLKKMGVECEIAEDGQIAVDKFMASKDGYYDAILMDIQMPNMDGLQASRTIRRSAHPQASRIQIIALSANAFNEDINKSLSNGMNDHISKPIDPQTLYLALKKAFDQNNKH
jgi:signal transduction histidine kinase/CheY-like chemotaxis protein